MRYKNYYSLLILTTLLSVNKEVYSQGFRGLNWGSTKEQIRAKEGKSPIVDEPNRLIYEKSLQGYDAAVHFEIVPKKGLTIGMYQFAKDIADKPYLFQKMKDLLTYKYGAPKKSESEGMYQKTITWDAGDTEVQLFFSDRKEVNIFYTWRKGLADGFRQIRDRETKDL